jgi:hypothetical protein
VLLLEQLFVVLVREQLAVLAGVARLELDHPALAVGRLVHQRGIRCELAVHLDHLARDRRVEVAHRLHRLDHAERLHRVQLLAHRG